MDIPNVGHQANSEYVKRFEKTMSCSYGEGYTTNTINLRFLSVRSVVAGVLFDPCAPGIELETQPLSGKHA